MRHGATHCHLFIYFRSFVLSFIHSFTAFGMILALALALYLSRNVYFFLLGRVLFTSISSNGSGFTAICNFTVFNRTRSHHLPLAELWCGADVVCVLCVFSIAVWDEEIDLHHLSTNTLKYSGILGERIGNSKRCYGNSHWKVFIVCISQ